MKQTRVKVLYEVPSDRSTDTNTWTLCFQYVRYEFADGSEQEGYRFIWRKPDGNLQGARGQARIPSVAKALELISLAMAEGWGDKNGDLRGYSCDEDE